MALPADYIAAAIVPAVMISAAGLLCLALYNRLAAIVARLRGLFREQLRDDAELRPPSGGDAAARGYLEAVLEREAVHVLRRARLVRGALVCLIGCVMAMSLCSLTAGVATLWPAAGPVAVGLFVLGQLLLTLGLLLALLELRLALRPVEIESRAVAAIRGRQRRRPPEPQ